MDFAGKNVLVIGYARSGAAAASLLLAQGARVHVQDNRTCEAFEELASGIEYHFGEDPLPLIPAMDIVVISPGVHIDSPAALETKRLGKRLIGEIELAYLLSQGQIVAITGTNGKTTTTAMCGEMFKNAGKHTYVVGNIGNPFSGVAAQTRVDDVVVCEVSSFQLESTGGFRPQTSVILNIEPEHLDRHGDMETYIALKARIFDNQVESEFAVLNYDDPIVRGLAARCPARVVYFSRREKLSFGAWVQDGDIVFSGFGETQRICPVSDLQLIGAHNVENALAVVAVGCVGGVRSSVIRETLQNFKGVEHRIEPVRELRGIQFINDSKGTNVAATLRAIEAVSSPLVLLLGGFDEKADFAPLAREIAGQPTKVRHVVTIGETAPAIEAALRDAGFSAFTNVKEFADAVRTAYERAESGQAVLLSPACASYDMFKDYEQRGRLFKEIVNGMEA